jgi:transmembrane sensor
VAAHGTLFDVALTPARGVAVTLLQGVVEVDAASGAGRRDRTTLAPGQELAFGRDLPVPQLRPASPNVATWPSGMLTFSATPLSQAVAEANRYSHTAIRLASPDLGLLQVSGAFHAGAARPLAESLAATFDLRIRAAPDGALVLERPPASSAS